jgi:hypothetical protein
MSDYLPYSSKPESFSVIEAYSASDLIAKHAELSDNPQIARKYDMDSKATLPPTHPDYIPHEKEIILNDSTQILNQQYNTMIMTVAATAALGLIAFMVTANP